MGIKYDVSGGVINTNNGITIENSIKERNNNCINY